METEIIILKVDGDLNDCMHAQKLANILQKRETAANLPCSLYSQDQLVSFDTSTHRSR